MKYRVQADLSFNTQADADSFESYVRSLKAKLYVPTEKEVADRSDLWVNSRLCLIKDYDDEGNNVVGETGIYETLIKPKA